MTAKNGKMIPAATAAKMTALGLKMLALETRTTKAAAKMIAAAAVKLMATTEAETTTPAVLMIREDGIRNGLIQAKSPLLQASSKVKHRLINTYFVPACVLFIPCK